MPNEVAVMLGADGKTVSLNEGGILTIYQRNGCHCSGFHWQQSREKHISLGEIRGIKELRVKMAEVIAFMGDCRQLIIRNVTGVPYFELEKAGFNVWEADGNPLDYLDQVDLESNNSIENADEENHEVPVPLEVFPGCYRISLAEIQQNHTHFTSKQVLLPFLHQGNFHLLEILCDHIPPWLEAGLISGEYIGSIEACGRNMSKITIASSNNRELLQPFSMGISE